jgi:hypothetical protein
MPCQYACIEARTRGFVSGESGQRGCLWPRVWSLSDRDSAFGGLVLLARFENAKQVEILVLRHRLASREGRLRGPGWTGRTGRCWPRRPDCCRASCAAGGWSPRARCSGGTDSWPDIGACGAQ